MEVDMPSLLAVAAIAAPAVWTDCRRRRIANNVVLGGLLLGLGVQVAEHGLAGLALGVGGALVGLVCLLPFHLGGALGAGDVKLMAALGSVLGPVGAFAGVVLTLLAGAALATAWLLWQRRRASPAATAAGYTLDGSPVPAAKALPYAIAVAAGSLAASLFAATGQTGLTH